MMARARNPLPGHREHLFLEAAPILLLAIAHRALMKTGKGDVIVLGTALGTGLGTGPGIGPGTDLATGPGIGPGTGLGTSLEIGLAIAIVNANVNGRERGNVTATAIGHPIDAADLHDPLVHQALDLFRVEALAAESTADGHDATPSPP